ncbi:MAG: hypothetical protein ABIY51_11215 [Ferruginibacter sp.]
MNNAQFDDHIKTQFEDYEPEVPTHIWENIVKEKNKRRPGIIWWLPLNKTLLLLFIAVATGAGIVWYSNSNSKTSGKEQLANNKPAELNNLTASSSVNIKDNPQQKIEQDKYVDPLKNTVTTSTTANNFKTSQTAFTTYITEGNVGTVNENAPALNNVNDDWQALTAGSSFAERLSFTPGQPKFIYLKHASPTPCPDLERNTSGNKKYIDFYAGPDYSMATYSDTGNSNYKQLRQASTKSAIGFSAGIHYTKVFNNSMSIRTGLNYSQVNEKFTYKQGNYVQVVYIINNNGDTTGSYSVTGTRYKNSTNVYRMADIPLVVGYEMGNDRLHANINAGVIINVHSWQKANVVDTSNNPIDVSTGTNTPYSFKTNAGVGFIAGVSVYYKLNDKLHLMAEPYFRYNLSQANKTGITLKQKFNTAGVRLGVRLDIP